MDIGDYYYKSFKGFKENPNLAVPSLVLNVLIYIIVFLGAFFSILMLAGSGYFSAGSITPNMLSNITAGSVILFALMIIVFGVIIGLISSFVYAATIGMSKRIIVGERPGLNVGLDYGKKYFLKIFIVSILLGILGLITFIPLILGVILDYMYGLGFILSLIGGIITVIGLIVLSLFFIFTYQSIVLGKKSIIGSLKKSMKLFRKNIFEVIIVLIINAVIAIGVGIIISLINTVLGFIPILGIILGIIINIVAYSLMYPYLTLVLTYLYLDTNEELPAQEFYH